MSVSYQYVGSGSIEVFGCSGYAVEHFYAYRYNEGSRVYILAKAIKEGKLESVVVRKVEVKTFSGQVLIFYVDGTNARWKESDLCPQSQAVDIAEQYWKTKASKLLQMAKNCT